MASKKDWKNHLYRVDGTAVIIERLFRQVEADIVHLTSLQQIDKNKTFEFKNYPILKNHIDEAIKRLAGQMLGLIQQAQQNEWEESNRSNDELVDEVMRTINLPREIVEKYKDHNLGALITLQQRKTSGMNLSQRVWNLNQRFKSELELALDIGLGEAKSAQELSQDVRQYLNEPNKLFRRVRDKFGNLQLSKAAKAYNPGQGVYRSSYKNAMRLTRTEISMAYRDADFQRWQNLDFVVGYEVKRSNNYYDCPVCEPFKGLYPKTFKFRSWHPHCRCFAVSILATRKELSEMESKLLNDGSIIGFNSVNTVNHLPQGYVDYIKDNKAAISKLKKQPYYILDNYRGGHISGGVKDLKLG